MPSTVRSSGRTSGRDKIAAGRARGGKAQQPANITQGLHRRRLIRWAAGTVVALLVVAGIFYAAVRADEGGEGADDGRSAAPVVGTDLHSVTVIGDALYVGGHEAVAVSHDHGRQWHRIASLDGADAMAWAATSDALLVGGHPGLFRSTDGGATFSKVTGAAAGADVHALGGAAATVYLASPTAGLLASTDAGNSWQARNAELGRSFMGAILVDPGDPARLIAAAMSAGLQTSSDGGRTWKPLGGPARAAAVAWNPSDIREIVAVGREGGARSTDGGVTWQAVRFPAGVSAVTYDATGSTMYAGVLNGKRAEVYRSDDDSATWTSAG